MSEQNKPTIPGWAWFYDSADPHRNVQRSFICGETSRSWVHAHHERWADAQWAHEKAPKKTTVFVSEEEANRMIAEQNWTYGNRSRIAQMVSDLTNYDTLRKIAELVGYREDAK